MYTATEIAKYVISKCTLDGYPVSDLELQNILYLTQREYLRHGECAFTDPIEAWRCGPIVPSVYKMYCGFGSLRIRMNYHIHLESKDEKIIDAIILRNRPIEPWDRAENVQASGGAWSLTYREGSHRIIPTKLIKEKG